MKSVVVDARHLHSGTLTPPLSKSDAQRAQVLAWLTGQSVDLGAEDALPADVRVMRRGLEALSGGADIRGMRQSSEPLSGGADVRSVRQSLEHFSGEGAEIDCLDGGAPFRLLLTQAALIPGARTRFIGSPRLGQRPHLALIEALRRTLGADAVRCGGAFWPVEVTGATPQPPHFLLDASESSQFATSLLLGCAALVTRGAPEATLALTGTVASRGYLQLTLHWLEQAGFVVEEEAQRFKVKAPKQLAALPAIPGDWSSLGYLLITAWATGGSVLRVDPEASHPDRELVGILRDLGLELRLQDQAVQVSGAARGGLRASGETCPDLLPTLAALACALPEPSVLEHTEILVGKESDRRAAVVELVRVAGGSTRFEKDTLHLTPPARLPTHFAFHSRGDHRLAMSAATLAVLSRAELTLTDPECVEKSFPTFWRELEQLGVVIR